MNVEEAERFVDTWQQSGSLKEAAEKLGISIIAASQQASCLRRAGVSLKKFQGGPQPTYNVKSFIGLWQSANSLEEAACLIGVPVKAASQKACALRNAGYDLKQFHRKAHCLRGADIDALNKRIPPKLPDPKRICPTCGRGVTDASFRRMAQKVARKNLRWERQQLRRAQAAISEKLRLRGRARS